MNSINNIEIIGKGELGSIVRREHETMEYDECRGLFSLPIHGNDLRRTEHYTMWLPRSVPVQVRMKLWTAARDAMQAAVDKMGYEEFEFHPKKD